MGYVTKYVCDSCSHEQDTREQMWDIGILVNHVGHTQYHGLHDARHKALWCRKCCDEHGVLGGLILKSDTEEKPPTLEDIIRQIVQDENSK